MAASTTFGSNHRSAAAAHAIHGGVRAELRMEDLKRLRETDDAREQWDPFACKVVRVALAVPVLIQAADGIHRPLLQTDAPHHLRTLITAQLEKRFGVSAAVHDHVHNGADPVPQPLLSMNKAEQELELVPLIPCPVVGLGEGLGPYLIAADDLVQAAGVCAAAGVLQQQRIMQVAERLHGQSHLHADAHAQEARAQGVAGPGALRQVERIGEGRNDLRDTQRPRPRACMGPLPGNVIRRGNG